MATGGLGDFDPMMLLAMGGLGNLGVNMTRVGMRQPPLPFGLGENLGPILQYRALQEEEARKAKAREAMDKMLSPQTTMTAGQAGLSQPALNAAATGGGYSGPKQAFKAPTTTTTEAPYARLGLKPESVALLGLMEPEDAAKTIIGTELETNARANEIGTYYMEDGTPIEATRLQARKAGLFPESPLKAAKDKASMALTAATIKKLNQAAETAGEPKLTAQQWGFYSETNKAIDEMEALLWKKDNEGKESYSQSVPLMAADPTGATGVFSEDVRMFKQIEARMLSNATYFKSGAQAGQKEVEEMAKSYKISPTDNAATARAKLTALRNFLEAARRGKTMEQNQGGGGPHLIINSDGSVSYDMGAY